MLRCSWELRPFSFWLRLAYLNGMKRQTVLNLDQALNFLYDKQKELYTHESLKEICFKNNGEIDVQAIIDKFDKDGCLHYAGDTTKKQFKISIDGCILKERGGYKTKFFWDWPQRHQVFVSALLIIFTTILTHTIDLLFSKCPPQSKSQSQVQSKVPPKGDNYPLSTLQKHISSTGEKN